MAQVKLTGVRIEATVKRAFKTINEMLKVDAPVMQEVGDIFTGIIHDLINAPGRGRIYVRPGGTHTASAPGDPPATDTGNLVENIGANIVRDTEQETAVGVGVNSQEAPYWEGLNDGTDKVEPRPYIQRGLDAGLREVPRVLFPRIVAKARRVANARRTR